VVLPRRLCCALRISALLRLSWRKRVQVLPSRCRDSGISQLSHQHLPFKTAVTTNHKGLCMATATWAATRCSLFGSSLNAVFCQLTVGCYYTAVTTVTVHRTSIFPPLKGRQPIKLLWNFDTSGTVYPVTQYNILRIFSSTDLRNSNLTSSVHILITSLSVMFPFRWTLIIVCAKDMASFRPITSKSVLTYLLRRAESFLRS